jgi:colanic acid/amylovoran biosynthesis protein
VSTGGTYLVENYPLFPRIFDYKISLVLEKPLIFFTQSLGPFLIPSNRQNFKRIFEESLLILLRDRRSENNILDLNPEKVNTYVTADAAFALADPVAIAAAQSDRDFSSPLNIAISVRDWHYFKTIDPDLGRAKYLRSITTATEHLVNRYGAKVTFISTCQGIPEYWTNDSKVALEITQNLATNIANSVSVNCDFHSPLELAEMLKSFDFVISTRLHMAILALGVGTLVLPIAYEFKTQELFKNFGRENLVIDIEKIDEQLLIDSTDSLIASKNEISSVIFPAVQKESEKALNTSILIEQAFKRSSNFQ